MKILTTISILSFLLLSGCGKDVSDEGGSIGASVGNVTTAPNTPADARCENAATKVDLYQACCTRPSKDEGEFKCCVKTLGVPVTVSKKQFWEAYEKRCYKLKEAINS